MTAMPKPRVLFLCTGNSARSQMAEGWLRALAGDRFEVYSAGTHPSSVNPLAIIAMREVGIDISQQHSKSVGDFLGTTMQYVVTVCDRAKESCPIFPFTFQVFNWSFDDPAEASGTEDERLAIFRRVRDETRHQNSKRFHLHVPGRRGMKTPDLFRKCIAEFLGTLLLVSAVVGSGIMADRLSAGNVGLALLANSIATGGALLALILTFGAISGAHFNPAVTLSVALEKGIAWRETPAYVAAQFSGGIVGTLVAHSMFSLPMVSASRHVRAGRAQVFSEFVATFGLMAVIWGCSRLRSSAVPLAVASYIVAAYWFTSSTSFANPAVTVARALTDTFTGIRPTDVLPFIAAQLAGALAATLLFRFLVPQLDRVAPKVVLPHAPR